jgi:glycosyltransferase involved in cell wall biosynthesis
MRIAYMLTSLGIGGAERQVVALAEHMAAQGHAVLLIVLKERQAEQWPTHIEVKYLEMQRSPLSILSGIARGRGLLRMFKPDLVHSHTFPANMVARALRLSGATPAVLSTIHNVYEGGWARMLAYRMTDPLTLHTTAVSTAAGKRFVELKAVPRRKCTILTNAIDTKEFAPDGTRRERMRTELAAGDDFIWLAAGRITAAKDYPNLLRAFAQAEAAWPQTQLWVAGEGNPPVCRELQRIASALGIAEKVCWLGLRRDMPALLDAADGFVLSSAWEGMPLVLGEAMAMEKPVVATDVGGVKEIAGTTGTIVSASDSVALGSAMLKAMGQPLEIRLAMGRAARQRIEEHFSAEVRLVEWETFYGAILGCDR